MKAGLAALTLAFLRLREAGSLKGGLKLAFVSDEEAYSRGFEAVLNSGFLKDVDAALSGEPTGHRKIETGKRGRIVFRVDFSRVRGNPLTRAAGFILALKSLGRGFSPLAVESELNMDGLPASCRVAIDRLLLPGETHVEALNQLKGLAAKFKGRVGLHPRPTPYMLPYRLRAGEPIVQALKQACLQVLGFKPRQVLGPPGDENHLTVRCGIPTVAYGPKGGRIHRRGEYVELDSAIKMVEVYVETAIKFLSSSPVKP